MSATEAKVISGKFPDNSRREQAMPPLPAYETRVASYEVETPPADPDYRVNSELEECNRYIPGQSLTNMRPSRNQAMALARNADFLDLCSASLLPGESKEHFAMLLEGLVEQYLPKNRYHLSLLGNIAEKQWALQRAARYRNGIYRNMPKEAGSHGMKIGIETALNYVGIDDTLMRQLDAAILLYRSQY